MEYALNQAGFEGHQISVRTGGWFTPPKVMVDGDSANKGDKRGQFLLRRNDGSEALFQLKNSNPLDPAPRLTVDGLAVQITTPVAWYHWVWVGLPVIFLLYLGGLLGGLCGGIAAGVNGRIFRSENSIFVKYLYSGAISFSAIVVYFVLGIGFLLAIGKL